MSALLATPAFAIALTVLAFALASQVRDRVRRVWCNPILLAMALVTLALRATGLDYAHYARDTQSLSFFLGPAVVALGLSLHRQGKEISRLGRSLPVSVLVGSLVGVVTATTIARGLGAPREIVATLAPKSVTTPIAMAISAQLGGIPSLAAVLVILVGVFGAMVNPLVFRLLGIRSPSAWGLAMGGSAHVVGTARALEEGPTQGAAGAVAVGLFGLATALWAPLVMRLLDLLG